MGSRERELEAALAQKHDELEGRNKLLEKTKIAIETLKKELVRVKENEEQLKHQAKKAVEEQASRAHDLEDELRNLEADMSGQISKAEAERTELTTRCDELEHRLDTTEQQKMGVEGDLELLRQKLQLVKERLEENRENQEQSESALQERNEELEESGRQLNRAEEALLDMNAALDQERGRVKQLMAERDERDQTIVGIRARMEAAEQEAAALKEQATKDSASHAEELRQSVVDAERREAEARAREDALDIRRLQLAEEAEADKDTVVALKLRLRDQLSSKVGSISDKIEVFAGKERTLEAALAGVSADLAVARAEQEGEARKRRELEHALREAADLFKKEMWAKNEALAGLQGEVARLRLEQADVRAFSVSGGGGRDGGEEEGSGGGGGDKQMLAIQAVPPPAAPPDAEGLEEELISLRRTRESYQGHSLRETASPAGAGAGLAARHTLSASAAARDAAELTDGLEWGRDGRFAGSAAPPPPPPRRGDPWSGIGRSGAQLGSVYSSSFGRAVREDAELSNWHDELSTRLGTALKHLDDSRRRRRHGSSSSTRSKRYA